MENTKIQLGITALDLMPPPQLRGGVAGPCNETEV